VTRSLFKPAAVIAAVIVGLASVDQFLARVESAEVRATATRSFSAGTRLLDEGKVDQSVEFLRTAHGLERNNQEYQVLLIRALRRSGRIPEAEELMSEALQREPNDGLTNLAAARVMVAKEQIADAGAYYHRAIYGEWPADAGARRVEARRELIAWLLKRSATQEALAELIALDEAAPNDPAIRKELARGFLTAGSPARAAAAYEALIGKDPSDRQSYEGLGEAELELGKYREARSVFEQASAHDPNSEAIRGRLELLDTVTSLDPTPRQLGAAEKYRRSVRVLDLARERVEQCGAADAGAAAMAAAARKIPARASPADATNEGAESVLSLAEALWHAHIRTCGHVSAGDEALRLIMEKLTP
jgi:tetratricopeptide (TPR) repeat protein